MLKAFVIGLLFGAAVGLFFGAAAYREFVNRLLAASRDGYPAAIGNELFYIVADADYLGTKQYSARSPTEDWRDFRDYPGGHGERWENNRAHDLSPMSGIPMGRKES